MSSFLFRPFAVSPSAQRTFRVLIRGTVTTSAAMSALTFAACSAKHVSPDSATQGPTFQQALLDEETSRGEGKEFEVPQSSTAQYQFLRGQLALANENFDEALKYLESAAKLEPTPAPTLRRSLAQLYIRMGRIDDALKEVTEALKQSPKDIELLQLRGGLLATKKDIPGAIETYRKVIEIATSPSGNKKGAAQDVEETYVLMASLQAQASDLNGAKATLLELLGRFPDSFFGHYYYGRMSEGTGLIPEAEIHYKRALEVNPQADSVRLDLARVYGSQKRYPEAIDLAQKYVEENPKNLQGRALLAQLLVGDNRVDKAIEQFEEVGSLQQDPTEARLKIALLKLQRRDLEGAITELNLVLTQHPQDNTARYYLASAYAGLKKITDAVTEIHKIAAGQEYFVESRILGTLMLQQEKRPRDALDMIQEAAVSKPDDIKVLTLRASIERELENKDAAIATMRRVTELEPTKDRHFFTLGVFLDEAGKKEDAIAAMRKAIELDPKNANALNYLGYSFAEKHENLEEAESLIRRAIAVEKDNGYYLDSLGWLFFQQGKYQDAARELERAVKRVPSDAVILEHYARALQKVGNKKLSEKIAKQALEHAADSDDQEVSKRLNDLILELKR